MNYEAYVIAIENHEQSQNAANKCIRSAERWGEIEVQKFKAVTPADRPREMMMGMGMNIDMFEEKYSRLYNVLAAFMSHYKVWERCAVSGIPTVVFEHDAIVTGKIPVDANFMKVMTFSRPSYGGFEIPNFIGVGNLSQKEYFGGAHGYMIKPQGAFALMDTARERARPTDLFLNKHYFPWIQEYSPWVCEARDTFSTIQNTEGCIAKHNYNEEYEILNA